MSRLRKSASNTEFRYPVADIGRRWLPEKRSSKLASSPIADPAFEEVRIHGAPELRLPPIVRQAKREAIAREKAPERKITVSSATDTIDPRVAQTQRALRKARTNDQGLLTIWGREFFRVSVAPANVERAVNILNALARAAEERRYTIEPAKNRLASESTARFSNSSCAKR